MLKRLVTHYGVEQAIGLTLSQAQANWISNLNIPKIQAHVESWEAHEPEMPYDALISIGAFEHFAKPMLSSDEKVEKYRRFFEKAHKLLKPNGHLSLQTIAYSNVSPQKSWKIVRDTLFISAKIFPESDLPHLHEIAKACKSLFEIVTLRNDRLHYAKTCATWLKSLKENRQAAVAVTNEKTVALYEEYLEVCVRLFEQEVIELLRLALRRVGN